MGIDVQMSRRGFVKGASALATASLLAACTQGGSSPAANDSNENGQEASTTAPEGISDYEAQADIEMDE